MQIKEINQFIKSFDVNDYLSFTDEAVFILGDGKGLVWSNPVLEKDEVKAFLSSITEQ